MPQGKNKETINLNRQVKERLSNPLNLFMKNTTTIKKPEHLYTVRALGDLCTGECFRFVSKRFKVGDRIYYEDIHSTDYCYGMVFAEDEGFIKVITLYTINGKRDFSKYSKDEPVIAYNSEIILTLKRS